MKPVIFVGPSIAICEARAILDATYLPPAQQGSIVSIVGAQQPPAIGIIDGLFFQSLSVWHKEILYALDRGVRVFGAASIGALRGAELATFGMTGVGWVFEQYASGQLTDDDEVALAHGSADCGYPKMSEPLVNIRATLQQAQESGVLEALCCKEIIAAAKGIYFPERSLEQILAALSERGLAETLIARVKAVFTQEYVDIKKRDAILLLQTMRDCTGDHPPVDFVLNKSIYFEMLYNRDRQVTHMGVQQSLSSIVHHASLHLPDFESVRLHGLNRAMTVAFAQLLGLVAQQDDIQREGEMFRRRYRLLTTPAFAEWLKNQDMSEGEFNALMSEVATCRLVHSWWLSLARHQHLKTKVIMDELRLTGRYEEVAQSSAKQEKAIGALPSAMTEENNKELRALLSEHCRDTAFQISTPVARWANDVGFLSPEDFRAALLRAQIYRNVMDS
jgi:hypothetical protein